MKRKLILAVLMSTLNACGHPVAPNPIDEYLALAPAEATVQSNKRLQAFTKLFDQMKTVDLDKQISEAYAEKLYFNDTLVTLHDRSEVLKYIRHTQQQLDGINFKVLSCQDKGKDATVRWLMHNRFTVMGKALDIQTIGISHLRFNEDNKIILHQDFWDSMQGIYQHLPVIGGLLQWIKSGLYTP